MCSAMDVDGVASFTCFTWFVIGMHGAWVQVSPSRHLDVNGSWQLIPCYIIAVLST